MMGEMSVRKSTFPIIGTVFLPAGILMRLVRESSFLFPEEKSFIMAYIVIVALTVYSEIMHYTFVDIKSEKIKINGSWAYLNRFFPILGIIESIRNRNNEFASYYWDILISNIVSVEAKTTFYDYLSFFTTKTLIFKINWNGKVYTAKTPLVKNYEEAISFLKKTKEVYDVKNSECKNESYNPNLQQG